MTNTHRAVIETSVPPGLTLVAAGPREFCEGALTTWIDKYPLGEYDEARIYAVVAEESRDTLDKHLTYICREAGLDMMIGVFDVLINRETLTPRQLMALTAADITGLYEGWIAPAIDNVERTLRGDIN